MIIKDFFFVTKEILVKKKTRKRMSTTFQANQMPWNKEQKEKQKKRQKHQWIKKKEFINYDPQKRKQINQTSTYSHQYHSQLQKQRSN